MSENNRPLLDRLDAYAEIPDMDWNVQCDISEAAAAIREAREAMQMTLDYDAMETDDFEKKYGGRDKAHWLGTRVRLRSALAKLGGTA